MGFMKKFTDRLTAPHAELQLKLNNISVALGDSLVGTLSISSKEDFDSTEVRCEIRCVERAQVMKEVYDAPLRPNIPREVEESSVIFSANPVSSMGLHTLLKTKTKTSQQA
jgi:hypothetical protein